MDKPSQFNSGKPPAFEVEAVCQSDVGTQSIHRALTNAIPRLPVFPACASEVIHSARGGCLTAEQLIHIARRDPILAGGLIEAANSALYTWSGTVRTLEFAVLHLGEIKASRVLLDAAMRPILSIMGHNALWEHSLEVAHVAMKLASRSPVIHRSEAYVLGLLHDVGELLLRMAPAPSARRLEDLVKTGVNRPLAEELVYGASHAQAGGQVLRHWRMPDDYVSAVAYHHAPEEGGGAGAALLYLAEQWTNSNGDLLNKERLETSLAVLHLSEDVARSLGDDGPPTRPDVRL